MVDETLDTKTPHQSSPFSSGDFISSELECFGPGERKSNYGFVHLPDLIPFDDLSESGRVWMELAAEVFCSGLLANAFDAFDVIRVATGDSFHIHPLPRLDAVFFPKGIDRDETFVEGVPDRDLLGEELIQVAVGGDYNSPLVLLKVLANRCDDVVAFVSPLLEDIHVAELFEITVLKQGDLTLQLQSDLHLGFRILDVNPVSFVGGHELTAFVGTVIEAERDARSAVVILELGHIA